MIVSVVGIHVLHSDIYYDLEVFIFCCVIAASQYSLVKSCQPDVNTPVHVRNISSLTSRINGTFSSCQGFNRHTAISRAIYFCLFSSLLLFVNQLKVRPWTLILFGIKFSHLVVCHMLYNLLSILLLCLPLLFLFGLLPQCSTFCLCILENIDMHFFGGTAMINIPGALYSLTTSTMNFALLSTLGYYGLPIDTSKVRLTLPSNDHRIYLSLFSLGSYAEHSLLDLLWTDGEYLL